jgi:hypothetical protein
MFALSNGGKQSPPAITIPPEHVAPDLSPPLSNLKCALALAVRILDLRLFFSKSLSMSSKLTELEAMVILLRQISTNRTLCYDFILLIPSEFFNSIAVTFHHQKIKNLS